MPMYDFRCPQGHVFESLEPIGTFVAPCPLCPKRVDGIDRGVRVLLKAPSYRAGNANRLNMVVHRNEQGEYAFPGHVDAPVPEGFTKVEITDVAHARRIEKEVGMRERVKAEEHQHATTQYYDAVRKKEQDDLRAMMGGFSPKGKAFAEAALKDQARKSEERSAKKVPDSAAYFEALSMNASNREGHRDESTDWKSVK